MEEDTIFYADADKVGQLMKALSDQIVKAKQKSAPGATKLPASAQKVLDDLFSQLQQCLSYQNVQTKLQSHIDAGESLEIDATFLG